MRFVLHDTPLSGLKVVERTVLGDERGYLERMFCDTELKSILDGRRVRQVNHTLTENAGAVRGLHFQYPPHAETKFVNCIRGRVFDVAVDLRRNSPTFLKWHAEVLSADNHRSLLIPEGFAHGFQTLGEGCEMLYFHTMPYSQQHEGGLNAQDTTLAIAWPMPLGQQSARDLTHPTVDSGFLGIEL